MKLKLRIKKDLKRELKELAIKKDIERKELAVQLISEVVENNDELNISDIEGFIENTKELELEILKINENESLDNEERKSAIEELKGRYKVIIYTNKIAKKKTETLIIDLEEKIYYGFLLTAESNKMSIEQFGVKILTDYANANRI